MTDQEIEKEYVGRINQRVKELNSLAEAAAKLGLILEYKTIAHTGIERAMNNSTDSTLLEVKVYKEVRELR